uniref:Putative ribosomal protein n=1 Tax=Tabanus bromius TaxID=304241 RepID=A0A0K8TP19_TABBR
MSDKYAVPNKLPGKTVSILAHRKRRINHDKAAVEQKRQLLQKFRKSKAKQYDVKRAESFIMPVIKAERTKNRAKRVVLKKNALKTEDPDQKLLLVYRHCGKWIADEKTLKILRTLGLPYVRQAVFLRNNKENNFLLRLVEPYVTYGYPTITTIRELIFKHGYVTIDGKSTTISSNTMIEEHLGHLGVICLEDIINEIFTVGQNFNAVTRFLNSFQLRKPRDDFQNKVSKKYGKGGEYGNRKEAINSLIARCL